MTERTDIPKAKYLYQVCKENSITLKQLAEKYNCHESTIRRKITKYISKRHAHKVRRESVKEKIINKYCEGCVWGRKYKNYCPFQRCVKRRGWIKKNGRDKKTYES